LPAIIEAPERAAMIQTEAEAPPAPPAGMEGAKTLIRGIAIAAFETVAIKAVTGASAPS
jgi:hypothetical protein